QWGQKQRRQSLAAAPRRANGLPELLRGSIGWRWRWAERSALVAYLALEEYDREAGERIVTRPVIDLDAPAANRGATASSRRAVRRPNYLAKLKDFALGE